MSEQFEIEKERHDKDDNAKFRGSWHAVAQTRNALLRANVAKRAGVQLRGDREVIEAKKENEEEE